MRGDERVQDEMFSYVSLEQRVPADHPLREIRKLTDEILRELGYPDSMVARVQELNLKKNFPNDAEGRVLEDALCLVFLEFQLAPLAAKTDDDRMINALRKSWEKMTETARNEALKLHYGDREKNLIQRALAG